MFLTIAVFKNSAQVKGQNNRAARCRLHALPMHLWLFSSYSVFVPQFKDISDSKLPVGLNVSLSLYIRPVTDGCPLTAGIGQAPLILNRRSARKWLDKKIIKAFISK